MRGLRWPHRFDAFDRPWYHYDYPAYDAREVSAVRVVITLECTETGDRNYTTTKNKKTHPQRLELMKYCPRLRKYTLHREVR